MVYPLDLGHRGPSPDSSRSHYSSTLRCRNLNLDAGLRDTYWPFRAASSGANVVRADDASIVRAIVSLAHSLRLKVVAEGVETTAQLEFLKDVGCDQYQGYHFSRPLPAPDFATLMRSGRAHRCNFMAEDALRTQSKLTAYRRK